jgi:capsular polysaccharide biosynthesis protein
LKDSLTLDGMTDRTDSDFDLLQKHVNKHDLLGFMPVECKPDVVRNAIATYQGFVFDGVKIWKGSLFRTVSAKRKKYFIKLAWYSRLRSKKLKIAGGALLVHHIWSSGYFHWTSEVLIKLVKWQDKSVLLLLPEDYPGFVFQSASFLGYNNIKKIPKGYGVKVSELHLYSNPDTGYYIKEEVSLLRKEVLFRSSKTDVRDGLRIYISRSNAKLRRIVNEAEVSELLKSRGFTVLQTENLTFCEQVELFKNCKFLVAQHGAGLTNMIFMPEGSKILELHRRVDPESEFMNICYHRLSGALNHDYKVMFCEMDDTASENSIESDRQNIRIDITLLKEWLDQMEA